jgi:transposase
MKKKSRRQFTAQQKVSILREHLLNNDPVSAVCERHDLHPTVFYSWQRQFFENGAAAFQNSSSPKKNGLQNKIEKLEARLSQKDEVIAEVAEEFVKFKKELGEH